MESGDATVGRMPWSGRRRLASHLQVLVGVGGLLALLALAVGVAAFLIVSLEDDATDVSNRHVQYATAIHEAALSAKAMANEQRGFLLSGQQANLSQFEIDRAQQVYLNQFEIDLAEARSAFAVAAGSAVGASQRDAVDEARAGFEEWLQAIRADVRAYRNGSHARAIDASLGSTRELRKDYERSLADAYDLGVRSIESANNSLSDSASRGVTILLVYLAFALVIGVAVALWVVRAILKPAFVLSRNAIEVLTRARLLVEGDEGGSHHGVAVEVPIEVVNALAESALEAQQGLRPRRPAA
jgi:methyl-accepting chemotaxis protein